MFMRKRLDQFKVTIKTVSGLLRRRSRAYARTAKSWATALCFAALISVPAHAAATYSFNVYLSTAFPNQPAAAANLIANVTSYYISTVSPSAFFSNTYNITLFAVNPKYVPPPPPVPPKVVTFDTTTFQNDLQDMINNSSMTYLNGWADGEVNERQVDLNALGMYDLNCDSPTFFTTVQSSTKTFDLGTCEDALGNVSSFIYTQNFSTPTVIPGF